MPERDIVSGEYLTAAPAYPIARGSSPPTALTLVRLCQWSRPLARCPHTRDIRGPAGPIRCQSTLSVGVKAVLSSILLDNAEESGLVPVVVAWYDALFSGVLLLLICSFTGDIPRMANYFLDPHKPWDAVLVFCALGTVAFFYNFVALAFIQATSALAIMIAGNFKHVLLILMPLVLYDHDPSHALGWTHKIGISLFFFSLFCCTAIDVYNTWHKAEPTPGAKAQRASAPPNEATPLYKGSEVAKGGDASDEWRDDWRDAEAAGGRGAPCLPCVPPRTS